MRCHKGSISVEMLVLMLLGLAPTRTLATRENFQAFYQLLYARAATIDSRTN